MSKPLAIGGILVLLALVLGVVGFAIDVLRWVLILAAIIFVIGAVAGWLGRARTE
ncbi:MAG TPA: hypothetical protein VM287_11560 [Egibacteraceae bacterium]|nr:hypothetical protein [Egibacteraceae bacterium]